MQRDSQRSKVYAAERDAFNIHNEEWTLEECWIQAQRVLNRKVLQRHYPIAKTLASSAKAPVDLTEDYYPGIANGYGPKTRTVLGDRSPMPGFRSGTLTVFSNSGARGGDGRIKLPKWARNRYVVSHELAHCLAPATSWHDWRFCAAYLEVVKYMCGQEDADRLKESFKKHGVRFRAPRKRQPLTEEQREAARERLAKARAVKTQKAQEKRDALTLSPGES